MERRLLIGERSKQFPTEGEAPIIDLNDNILVEILIKLGCCSKVATQCKCVCKRWLGLISNHYFSLRFRQQNQNHSHEGLAAFFASPKLPETTEFLSNNPVLTKINRLLSLNFNNFLKTSFNVLAIYRDLVLLCHKRESVDDDVCYYVCNPRTKQWVTLPPCPWFDGQSLNGFICDFDEDGEMKITVLRLLLKSDPYYEVKIFSSDVGQWRYPKYSNLYQLPVPYPRLAYHVSIQGLTHTVACNGTIFLRDHMKRLIGFNPVDHLFRLIDLPPFPFIDSVEIKDIGVCGGKLRICQWTEDDHICIWELESLNTNRWSLVHELYFNEFNDGDVRGINILRKGDNVKGIDFHPNDGDIVHLHRFRGVVYPCNLRKKIIGLEIDFSTTFSSLERDILNASHWVPGAYFLDYPIWPTSLPPILHSKSNNKNKEVFLPEMVLTSDILCTQSSGESM